MQQIVTKTFVIATMVLEIKKNWHRASLLHTGTDIIYKDCQIR